MCDCFESNTSKHKFVGIHQGTCETIQLPPFMSRMATDELRHLADPSRSQTKTYRQTVRRVVEAGGRIAAFHRCAWIRNIL